MVRHKTVRGLHERLLAAVEEKHDGCGGKARGVRQGPHYLQHDAHARRAVRSAG